MNAKTVRNKRNWRSRRNGQNARLEAVFGSLTSVALCTLRALSDVHACIRLSQKDCWHGILQDEWRKFCQTLAEYVGQANCEIVELWRSRSLTGGVREKRRYFLNGLSMNYNRIWIPYKCVEWYAWVTKVTESKSRSWQEDQIFAWVLRRADGLLTQSQKSA